MKKIVLSVFAMMSVLTTMASEFTTAGDGKTYTFATLAEASDAVSAEGNVFTVNDDITIAPTDVLMLQGGEQVKMADGVCITIQGTADLNAKGSAMFTRNGSEAEPKGIRVEGQLSASNVVFEYMAIQYVSSEPLLLDACTFRYATTKMTSTAAIAFSTSNSGNVINNCQFIQCQSSAIGGALNYANGMTISNCFFYDNNTENTNKPQVNLISGGDEPIIISGCTFIGTGRNMVGGLGFMNYMNQGTNEIIIENNVIQGHRYGMTAYSYAPLDVTINNNKFVDNKYESDPNAGGSGISLYDMGAGSLKASASGNYISGNLWGVTVLGAPEYICFGNLDDEESTCLGGNIFAENGNNGVAYDFFNNTSNDLTIYAQGNIWGVETQDKESINTVVWDSEDAGGHGSVIYFKDNATGINAIAPATTQKGNTYDLQGRIANDVQKGIVIKDGKKMISPSVK